jgi:tricorn protease interacting factor F2/3
MKIDEYILDLDVDFQGLTFKGKETIKFKSDREKLSLNSAELEIESVHFGNEEIKFSSDEKTQTLNLQKEFTGDSEVLIRFRGRVSESLQGLYIARYSKGEYMLSTQFESTGARFLFPCIDHPAYKAKFSLNLTIDHGLDAISNMPQSSVTQLENGKTLVRFHQTPPMSTYLIYIGIGKIEERTIKADGYECILAAPKGLLNSSDVPVREAISFIGEYEKYFGVKYVLPKVHLIAVPEFAAGAMENWGAITFREVLLMLNKGTSTSIKQTVSEVIAHELAHQWFGNLVTMKWWNDLWLNESFATFMAFKMVDRTHGEWEFMNRFIQSETAGALNGDSLVNTHPIDADVRNPDEVAQIFDEISYGKGASILRMIENYVGEEKFRDGIRIYLKRYQYGNAMGSDLWSCIEEASGMPISRIMEAWIKRKGYPFITASREGSRVLLKQQRFMLDGKPKKETWPIPVTYRDLSGDGNCLFETDELSIESHELVSLNREAAGFYRVFYQGDLLTEVLKNVPKMSGYEKWSLLNDAYAFLSSRMSNFDTYMKIASELSKYREPIVMRELISHLNALVLISGNSKKIKDFARNISSEYLNFFGDRKKDENPNISIARGAASSLLVLCDESYRNKLSSLRDSFFRTDPDLRAGVALAISLDYPDEDYLFQLFSRAGTDEDRVKIISAMGWSRNSGNLKRALEMIMDGRIKKQDSTRFYISASHSPNGRVLLLDNFERIIMQLRETFVGSRTPARVIEDTVPYLGLDYEKRIRETLKGLKTDDLKNGISKGLELLDVNLTIRNSMK